jgi:hypothetical protein
MAKTVNIIPKGLSGDAGLGLQEQRRRTRAVIRNVQHFLHPLNPEDRCHLHRIGVGTGRRCCRLSEEERDVVGASAEQGQRRISGYENCGGGQNLLLADLIPQKTVGVVQHRLCDACAEGREVLRDAGRVVVGGGLAGEFRIHRLTRRNDDRRDVDRL